MTAWQDQSLWQSIICSTLSYTPLTPQCYPHLHHTLNCICALQKDLPCPAHAGELEALSQNNISIWCWRWCSSYELLSCPAPEHYKSSSLTVILLGAGWDFIEPENLKVRGKPFNVLEMKVNHCHHTRDLLKGIRAENVHTESTELKFHFSLWNIWIFVIISQSLDFSRPDPGQAPWCVMSPDTGPGITKTLDRALKISWTFGICVTF